IKKASVMYDRESRGFGFVTLATDLANAAVTALNGTELNGKILTVDKASPPTLKSH
ncbi:hypothetical protein JOM56_015440, partial [Amanita muscaria]